MRFPELLNSSAMPSKTKSRALKNVSYLTIGSGISQIISLIGAFYIPRILGPKDYGIYQTVLSYVAMFTIFTFSGLNKVVLRECSRNLENSKEIIESTIGVRNLFSVLASLISMFIVIFINYEVGTKIFVIIFSLTLMIGGLRDSFGVIYQANERMEYIAGLTIIRAIISVSLSILFVALGYGVLSLILIQLFTGITILAVNYRVTKNFVRFNILSKIRYKKQLIQQGVSFSLLNFLNFLSGKVDLVMISILGTPTQVGIYALAYNFVRKGLIVRQAVSQSFFPVYTKAFAEGTMKNIILLKHTIIITLPALTIAFLVPFFSEQIVTIIVGSKYLESVQLINILMYYLVLNYLIVPFGLSLQTSNNENSILIIVSIKAILNVGCNIWFYYLFGIIGIAYSTLVNEGVSAILQIAYGYTKTRTSEK